MKARVDVMQTVEVEIPDSVFTPVFMEEFRKEFYDFDTPEEHFGHIAQMVARGLYSEDAVFIEGYGNPRDLGIKINLKNCDVDVDVLERA